MYSIDYVAVGKLLGLILLVVLTREAMKRQKQFEETGDKKQRVLAIVSIIPAFVFMLVGGILFVWAVLRIFIKKT